MWGMKLAVCIAVDLFDMTVGRLFFLGSGELIGCGVGVALFGWNGLWYALEIVDPTEQLDGFLPMATIIALANKPTAALPPS